MQMLKTAFSMPNGHFAMEKHLAMAEDIGHGQPFFYKFAIENFPWQTFFKNSIKTLLKL